MMRAFVVAVLLAAGVQQPDPSRHDKHKDDAHAFCLYGPPEKGDTHGHQCACKFTCGDDTSGAFGPVEDHACEMYCAKNRCACHPDEGCESSAL